MKQQQPNASPLLANAVEAILKRIRILAREMCPADRQKLEEVVDRAVADLSQIAAIETKHERDRLQ